MDEAQLAEIQAAITKARADGNIADAEALEGFLAQNKPGAEQTAEEKPMESTLVPGLVGSAGAIFGGGKAVENLANKYAPYDMNAPKTAGLGTTAPREFVSPEAVKARVEGRPLNMASTPSVSVQGISDAELVARKTPGAPGSVNYGKVMAGQTMPDVIANQIQTMNKVDEKGAYKIAAKDAANLEKIKGIGEGSQKLMNVNGTQLMLPEGASTQMLAEQKAAEKIAHEKALKEAGMERSTSAAEASKVRAERLAEIEKLKATSGAKAAAQLDKLKEILSVPQKYLTKAGEVGNILTGPLTTNMALRGLSGFGAAAGADETLQRWKKGEKGRAIISGLGAAGDVAAMSRHPAAMALGAAAGISAPMVNAYLDKWVKENPELAKKLSLKAGGTVKKKK
jgi:hypothetical protein